MKVERLKEWTDSSTLSLLPRALNLSSPSLPPNSFSSSTPPHLVAPETLPPSPTGFGIQWAAPAATQGLPLRSPAQLGILCSAPGWASGARKPKLSSESRWQALVGPARGGRGTGSLPNLHQHLPESHLQITSQTETSALTSLPMGLEPLPHRNSGTAQELWALTTPSGSGSCSPVFPGPVDEGSVRKRCPEEGFTANLGRPPAAAQMSSLHERC